MSDDATFVQIARTRERMEQLWRHAVASYGDLSAVSIRLAMIYGELVALEADFQSGKLCAGQAHQQTVLSKAQMDEIAALIAERLERIIYGEGPDRWIVSPESSKPS